MHVDQAAFDGHSRCLALLCHQDGSVQICTLDATFTHLRVDLPLPIMSWLPRLHSIGLVPGRKVCQP